MGTESVGVRLPKSEWMDIGSPNHRSAYLGKHVMTVIARRKSEYNIGDVDVYVAGEYIGQASTMIDGMLLAETKMRDTANEILRTLGTDSDGAA